MQFSQIVLFSLFGLTLASPVKRTAAKIEKDIAAISTQVIAFDASINSFTGTLVQALSLLSAYNSLNSAITSATADVVSTGALAATDSATIYAAVASLTPEIVDTLADADAAEPVVDKAGYLSYVCSVLTTLEENADAFYVALEGTIDSTYTTELTTLLASVDAAFLTTVGVYC